MKSLTEKEIKDIVMQYQEALLEYLSISKKEDAIKSEKIKAHYQMNLAREALRAINLN